MTLLGQKAAARACSPPSVQVQSHPDPSQNEHLPAIEKRLQLQLVF